MHAFRAPRNSSSEEFGVDNLSMRSATSMLSLPENYEQAILQLIAIVSLK